MTRPLVILESPFAPRPEYRIDPIRYARACLLHSVTLGEAPIASHLLYPQVLDDLDPAARDTGIAAGLAWRRKMDFAAFYMDLGLSGGMREAMDLYQMEGRPFVIRRLGADLDGFLLRVDTTPDVARW